jgi:hypothetical protein
MLRHKAMIQAARIAFGFAGIYDEDEAQRIASVTDAHAAAPAEDAPKTGKEALRARLKAKGTNTQAEATDAPQAAQTTETAKPDANADFEKRKEQGMLEIDELL